MSALDTAHDEFIEASMWHGPLEPAAALLAAHPDIATHSIHAAAILGDAATVRAFLARDPSSATGKGGPKGWDALTHLCFSRYLRLEPERTSGFVAAATALLDAGADPNTGFFAEDHKPNPEWECALYGAAGVAHNPDMTRLLVDRGANANDGEVVYHSPETLDNRTMKLLVESGKLTQDSITLMLVRKFDWHDDEGVAWLLDHGADPNFASGWGGRPMLHALDRGNPLRYFEWMLDHGGDPTLTTEGAPSIFAAAAQRGRDDVLELFERRGFKASLTGDDVLLAAIARGRETEARRIVESDPEIVARVQADHDGLLVNFAGGENLAAVRLLLDLGFDISRSRSEPPWWKGWTALHVAVGHGRLDTVQLLIARGAPLDALNSNGRTPLDVGLVSFIVQSEWTPNDKLIPIARALLAAGAPFKSESMSLGAAISLDRSDDVPRMLANVTREDTQLALAVAAYHGKVEGIEMLIAHGADVNAFNPELQTHAVPLHNAVSSGSLAAVKALVAAGARVDIKDTAYQSTPLDWANWYAREATRGAEAKEYAEIAAYLATVAAKS